MRPSVFVLAIVSVFATSAIAAPIAASPALVVRAPQDGGDASSGDTDNVNGGGVNNDGDDISNDGDTTCKSTTSSLSLNVCSFKHQHAADEEAIPGLALRKAETAAVSAVAETAHPGAQAAQTVVV